MNVSKKMKEKAITKIYDYLEDNPQKNMKNIMDVIDKIDVHHTFDKQRKFVREIVDDPQNVWYQYICDLLKNIDMDVGKTIFKNFIINSAIDGYTKQNQFKEKYQCNIPWAILLDPTSACNLQCTGCWAAQYGHQLNLDYETMNRIICEGKELGVYFYIYTGGEPLVRKKDLIQLCEEHNDCIFLTFTNGTLIDNDFAEDMLRVKNLVPAISVEGFEEATDLRRGHGTYQNVMKAMDLLKKKRLPFGISCCYTSQNVNVIGSEAYFDQMIEWGAKFCWFFHYMPVGNDAVKELMVNPQQREWMYHQVRQMRKTKPIFTIDFQNDGEYVGGCVAGGRRYLHINAKGDVEPCVFIHYSNINIQDHSLLESLQSPLFMAYHDHQPFQKNHLRPCPMLENPQILRQLVAQTNAVNTDYQSQESAEHLCQKCDDYAKAWQPVADKLWKNSKK